MAIINDDKFAALLHELDNEVNAAVAKHAPMHSHHEAYAVILEELDEYWDQVKLWPKAHSSIEMRKELLHVAAMALRAIMDLHLTAAVVPIDADWSHFQRGDVAICEACNQQITFDGQAFQHEGHLQPRHIAIPKYNAGLRPGR
jgi:hypothetical protein